jgi:hypothetical protein
MELTTSQKFEIAKFNMIIDQCDDIEKLREISKQLLTAWMTQRAATQHSIKSTLATYKSFGE